MALNKLGVGGYKPFAKEASFPIRPLTVLFGTNSAGKSSLLRLFPLLADSAKMRTAEPFLAGGVALKGAAIADLLSKHSKAPVLTLSFDFNAEFSGLIGAKYQLRQFDKAGARFVAIEELKLQTAASEFVIKLDLNSVEGFNHDKLKYFMDDTDEVQELRFVGLCPVARLKVGELSSCFHAIRKELDAMAAVTWLGPIRSTPARLELDAGPALNMDPFGNSASAFLARDSSVGGVVLKQVSNWFEAHFSQTLDVARGASIVGATNSLVFSPVADRTLSVAVMDTGEGMGQVIPVLTAAALAGSGYFGLRPYVVIEHPDLHLHANVHKALLDYFAQCIMMPGNPTVLIETHSEAILVGLQLAILEKRISHEDVVVHWIEADDSGASFVRSFQFDEKAYPQGGSLPGADWFNKLHSQMSELARLRIAG